MNLLQRLNAVMKEPGADYIQKNQKRINNQYTAVSHDQVARKLHPLFRQHGIIVTPSLVSGVTVPTGRLTQKGNPILRFEAVFAITFRNIDDAEDVLTINIPAHADDEGDKAPGKAVSYATKTAMLKALMIESGDEEEERVDGDTSGGDSNGPAGDESTTASSMDASDKATLLKQMSGAADTEKLTAIFKSAMAAAKEAGDSAAAAEFKAASIKRAELLKNPDAKGPADEKPAAASASIIKTLRKAMEKKGVDEQKVLDAMLQGHGVQFAKLDEISTEAAVWAMNDYLKTLEAVSA